MSKVFVLDTNKQPLDPVHPGRARMLLSHGKATVLKRFPFTIILKCAVKSPVVEPLRIKLDPGDNRRNKMRGWIAPSLESRVCNVVTWAKRLMRVCPIHALSQELVKFDMQAMENPEISGVEYQQGTLYGYEVREYLLEKWGRHCAYCGKTDVPLEVEHINPRSKSRDDRVCNLTLACEPCNNKKGNLDIRVFLAKSPDLLEHILAQAKAPLKNAAAVNITRWILYEQLKALGVPVECSSGGRTKYNRVTRGLEKVYWLDASCVGASTPEHLHIAGVVPLLIEANGYGSRQMCLMDKRGFPRTVQGISHRLCTLRQTCDGYSYKKGEAAFSPAP